MDTREPASRGSSLPLALTLDSLASRASVLPLALQWQSVSRSLDLSIMFSGSFKETRKGTSSSPLRRPTPGTFSSWKFSLEFLVLFSFFELVALCLQNAWPCSGSIVAACIANRTACLKSRGIRLIDWLVDCFSISMFLWLCMIHSLRFSAEQHSYNDCRFCLFLAGIASYS